MKNRNNLIIFSILAISVAAIFFKINKENKSYINTPEASLEAPQATDSCETEIINLFKKNDTQISKLTTEKKQLNWKGQNYDAMVLKCPDEKSYENIFLLVKTNKSGDKNILFSMSDERFDKSEIRDINKDGLGELIVNHGSYGNCWDCNGQSVFQIIGDEVKDLLADFAIPEFNKYANVWLVDYNKDGIEEFDIPDSRWELADGFYHSNAPRHTIILTWINGEYQYGGSLFSKYYLDKIATRNKDIEKLLKNKDTKLNDYIRLTIENYLDYQEIDKADLGWDTFVRQTEIENLPKTLIIGEEEKTWLIKTKERVQEEYKLSKTPATP